MYVLMLCQVGTGTDRMRTSVKRSDTDNHWPLREGEEPVAHTGCPTNDFSWYMLAIDVQELQIRRYKHTSLYRRYQLTL